VISVKVMPSVRGVRLPGELVRLPVRPLEIPADVRLPSSVRLTGNQELMGFRALEGNWKGLHAAIPTQHPVELSLCAGRHLDGIRVDSEALGSLGQCRLLLNGEWPADVTARECDGWLQSLARHAPEGEVISARRYLAHRALLEGRPDISKSLLGGEELPGGREVLRDLKALGGADGLPPPKMSALDGMPLPEPVALGVRPAVKEKLGKDLPDLEPEVRAAELAARKRVLGTVERSALRHYNHVNLSLYTMRNLTKSLASPGDEEKDREKEVETHLGRRLQPEERLLVRHLLRTMSPREVAAKLRELDEVRN
jgi:hypothetical protein